MEAGAVLNPLDRNAEPTVQAFCVPIIYLDRDALTLIENTYGLTVTTVVVKPKSRGFVRLRSADHRDMPLVSPNLLKDPGDAQEMIAAQRFFLLVFQTKPLSDRIEKIAIPNSDDLSDEAIWKHCTRFVKTNYHPSGTCRMGATTDKAAVLDASFVCVRSKTAHLRSLCDAEHHCRRHQLCGHDAGKPLRGVE